MNFLDGKGSAQASQTAVVKTTPGVIKGQKQPAEPKGRDGKSDRVMGRGRCHIRGQVSHCFRVTGDSALQCVPLFSGTATPGHTHLQKADNQETEASWLEAPGPLGSPREQHGACGRMQSPFLAFCQISCKRESPVGSGAFPDEFLLAPGSSHFEHLGRIGPRTLLLAKEALLPCDLATVSAALRSHLGSQPVAPSGHRKVTSQDHKSPKKKINSNFVVWCLRQGPTL